MTTITQKTKYLLKKSGIPTTAIDIALKEWQKAISQCDVDAALIDARNFGIAFGFMTDTVFEVKASKTEQAALNLARMQYYNQSIALQHKFARSCSCRRKAKGGE